MIKTIKDVKLKDKVILLRCDFNVPIKDGKIIDNTRINSSLKTINYCLEQDCKKVVLFSHLGRVKEKSDLEKNNLEIVSKELTKLLNKEVIFVNETRGQELENRISDDKNKIVLVQNTRYEDLDGKKESKNNEELGAYWASLGDIFINDAFGTIHRAHASNVGIAQHIKEKAIGFLIEKELNALEELNKEVHPFNVVLGGAKVSDKIGVIENLIKKCDHILIGGGMAFTFLAAEGYEIGNSLLDKDNINFCTRIINENPEKILLPIDVRVAKEFKDTKAMVKDINEIDFNEVGLDIGPKTEKLFENYLGESKVVVWNGPLGVYEFENFAIGTNKVLEYLVDNDIKVILGGGDIVAAASKLKDKDKIYHISTGGGATLEFLEGKTLPGLKAME